MTITASQPGETVVGFQVEPGRSHPLGAVPDEHGVNFSVFADRATGVELLLFDTHDAPAPVLTITLDPAINKIYHLWHVYVRGCKPGMHYAYRVHGPQDVHNMGDHYDHEKVLIDPYAKGNTNTLWDRGSACRPGDNV